MTLIFQYIIVALILIAAVGWLVKTYVLPATKKSGHCGGGDCGCK